MGNSKHINLDEFNFEIGATRLLPTLDHDMIVSWRQKEQTGAEITFNGFVRRTKNNYGEFAVGQHGNEWIVVFENKKLRDKGQTIPINYYKSTAVANNKATVQRLFSGFKAMEELVKPNTVTRLNFKLIEVEAQPLVYIMRLTGYMQVTDKGQIIKKTAEEYWKEKSNGKF